jgi:hypothetical protein
MAERAKPSRLTIIAELALPFFVAAACAQPVAQSDKAREASNVTTLIGAQKLPPSPPAAPGGAPAPKQKTHDTSTLL